MKRLVVYILLTFISLFFTFSVSAEEIRSFGTDIAINADGTINVKETLAYDFGNLDRHGIFRYIPELRVNNEGEKYILEYADFSVSDPDGVPYEYKLRRNTNVIILKIVDH